MKTDISKFGAYIFLLISSFLFGGLIVCGRLLPSQVPPVALATIRGLLGFLVLLPFAYGQLRKDPKPVGRDFGFLIIVGFLGITLSYTTFLWGIQHTSGINASIILAANPAVTHGLLAIGWRFRFSRRALAGMIISLIGLLYVFSRGSFVNLLRLHLSWGDLMIFANVIVVALFNILSQQAMTRFSPLTLTLYSLLIGTILLAPYGLWEAISFKWRLSWFDWLLILYMGAVVTGFALFLSMKGINYIGSNRAAMFTNLTPVFGIILSSVLLKETLAAYHWVGFTLVLVGMVLSLSYSRQEIYSYN